MNRHSRTLILALVGLLALTGVVGACRRRDPGPVTTTTNRADHVRDHSAEVMPFDITKATHTFTPTPDGLIETVVRMPPPDSDQVQLIRDHLAHEARQFQAGNWDDSAKIHGDDMPGLAQLRAADPAALTITYTEVPDGGRITYITADPALVSALHQWGAAQTADHGHEHGR